MKLLNSKAISALEMQMFNRARDIDVAIYNALTDTMPKEYVLDSLMLYINSDGGFGNGLYIDNYNTETSVYQIYEAFRIMDIVGIDSSCEHECYETIVNRALNFLYNRAFIEHNRWNPNISSTVNFAHASIFELNAENTALFDYHPTAALLGYTLRFCKPTKAYYKKALKFSEIMIDELLKMDSFTKYDFISFNSFYGSIVKMNLFVDKQEQIKNKIIDLALKVVSLDFDDLDAVHPIDCGLYLNDATLNEKIDVELDHIIDSIAPHGLWEHTTNWGNKKYPEEDSAMLKWLGAETVNNYYLLKKFGRLEGDK